MTPHTGSIPEGQRPASRHALHDATRGKPSDVPSNRPARRDDSHVTLQKTSTVDQLPSALAESLHYFIARYRLSEDESLPSPLGVVAALHQEGVTTISRALAAIVANDLDATVCWVELSPSSAPPSKRRGGRRSNSERSEVEAQPTGIFDVLTARARLHEVLETTDDDRLKLLRIGTVPENHRQTLARSSHLGALIDELSQRFDYVILEVPPVLAGSEALTILRHAAAHLMVVRHGVTTVQQVRSAANEIRDVPSLGVVINQFRTRIPKRLSRFFAP